MLPLLIVALVTGCSGTAQARSTPSPTADGDPAYCQELSSTITALTEEMRAPGAVVLVRSAELGDCFISLGSEVIGEDRPIGEDAAFRIGSNTKTMTGTIVLQLVEEGAISLDDTVSKYRADVPNGDEITIDQLLSMSSGLPDYSWDRQLVDSMDRTPQRQWTPDQLLALSFAQPPAFPPGEGYLYSNANTVLLGLIIEQLTGASLQEAFETRLFAPLGLRRTVLPPQDSSAMPDDSAHGYMFGTVGELIEDGGILSPAELEAVDAGTLVPNDVTNGNPSWAWAAGGVISTTSELADWVEALVAGDLIGAELLEHRLAGVRPIDPDDPTSAAYGEGIARYGALYGHSGELPGYNSFMGHDPERDLTIVAWSNLMVAPDGRLTATALSQAVIDQLYPQ